MVGGVSGNTPIIIAPERGADSRRPNTQPAPDPVRREVPAQADFDSQTARQLEDAARARRVPASGESEPIRLQSRDQNQLPLRGQEALSTYGSVASGGDEADGGELVGIDLRV